MNAVNFETMFCIVSINGELLFQRKRYVQGPDESNQYSKYVELYIVNDKREVGRFAGKCNDLVYLASNPLASLTPAKRMFSVECIRALQRVTDSV